MVLAPDTNLKGGIPVSCDGQEPDYDLITYRRMVITLNKAMVHIYEEEKFIPNETDALILYSHSNFEWL